MKSQLRYQRIAEELQIYAPPQHLPRPLSRIRQADSGISECLKFSILPSTAIIDR